MGFETTISAGERPKTYALDSAATGTGVVDKIRWENSDPSQFSDFANGSRYEWLHMGRTFKQPREIMQGVCRMY